MEQLSPSTTTTEPPGPEPVLRKKRSHHSEKAAHHKEKQPLLTTTTESLNAAMKTQRSLKETIFLLKKEKKLEENFESLSQFIPYPRYGLLSSKKKK